MKRVLPVVLLLAACGPPVDRRPPPFMPGGQEPVEAEAPYAGPYGYGVGSVVPDFVFYGFPRGKADSAGALQKITLGDFYNPSGSATFPEGSVHGAGRAKPLALVLDRSAVWCEPCNWEAANELPGRRARYAPRGELVLSLDQGAVSGDPATPAELTAWVDRYAIDYPSWVSPQASLSTVVGEEAYPGHVIVRTRDMKIIAWSAGVASASFWQLFEDTMDGKKVLPED